MGAETGFDSGAGFNSGLDAELDFESDADPIFGSHAEHDSSSDADHDPGSGAAMSCRGWMKLVVSEVAAPGAGATAAAAATDSRISLVCASASRVCVSTTFVEHQVEWAPETAGPFFHRFRKSVS